MGDVLMTVMMFHVSSDLFQQQCCHCREIWRQCKATVHCSPVVPDVLPRSDSSDLQHSLSRVGSHKADVQV